MLVVSGHTKGALTAIRQIAEMKVDVPMLAMTHCDAAKLSKQHGKKSEYALCASQWHKNLSYKDSILVVVRSMTKILKKSTVMLLHINLLSHLQLY